MNTIETCVAQSCGGRAKRPVRLFWAGVGLVKIENGLVNKEVRVEYNPIIIMEHAFLLRPYNIYLLVFLFQLLDKIHNQCFAWFGTECWRSLYIIHITLKYGMVMIQCNTYQYVSKL